MEVIYGNRGWILFAFAVVFGWRWRKLLPNAMLQCAPAAIAALVFITIHSYSALYDPVMDSTAVVSMIVHNVLQLIRSYLMASVGLIAFSKASVPIAPFFREETTDSVKRISVAFVVVVSVAVSVYSWILFVIADRGIPYAGPLPEDYVISEYALTATAAIGEELVARCFVLPIALYLMRQWKFRWTAALTVSSLFWTFEHSPGDIWRVLQLFPLGFVFGMLLRKYGLACAIVVHLLSNLLMLTALQLQ